MKELCYPFDSSYIMRCRRAIRLQLTSDGTTRVKKKIAVLGGSTTNDICRALELFLLDAGIEPEFWQSEYNRFFEDAVFGNTELDEFKPDIIYIHTTGRNLTEGFPEMTYTASDTEQLLERQFSRFETVWNKLGERFGCVIIQNNFELPFYRLLGNRDCYDHRGAVRYINRLNERFADYANNHNGFYLNDINYISASYGLDKWTDLTSWYMFKYAMSVEAIPYFSYNLAAIIRSIFGKNKKVLTLDMDNTLWGGIVGDDGVENLELGEETPTAQCYDEFQKYVKAQKQLGVLLTVNSKNEHENAIAGLNHPDSRLSPDDFTVIKANWNPKDINLKDTAAALDLGADAFVFVDDNPAERDIVSSNVPGVAVPEIGEPHEYIRVLDKNAYFEVTSFTEEDMKRGEMYAQNAKRAEMKSEYADYGEYLTNLQMHAEIRSFIPTYINRIAQLTNKSNQFNVTTKRYTVEEIERCADSAEYITLYGRLSDRFGDNGVVSVVIGKIEGSELHIEVWLMSCRVLKRDMEYAMLDSLVANCREKGVDVIYGYYYPTKKNGMAKELFGDFGFDKISDNDGDTVWKLNVNGYNNKNRYITVLQEEKNA